MKTNLPACRTLLSLALLAAIGDAAQAQSTYSPYFLGLSQTFSHESNMLQIADERPEPAGYTRSDRLSSTALLAGFDQSFGRQRGSANVTVRDNRYSNNKIFNNRSYNGNATLNWSTIERISGTLTATANRSLQRFNTAEVDLVTEKNLETSSVLGATANIGLVTRYSFDLGYNHRRVRNSLERAAVKARDFDQDAVNGGLRWAPSGSLSLGLGVASTEGRYPKFRTAADGTYQADHFKRNDLYLATSYQPSGASTLDARISRGRTHYDLNTQRDFSGTTGSFNWNWQATGKIRVSALFSRDTGQDSYLYSIPLFLSQPVQVLTDYSQIVQSFKFGADYAATAKISMTASLLRVSRSLVRTTDNEAFANAGDKEKQTLLALGVRWAPLRATTLGCDYSRDRRKTQGVLLPSLHDNIFSCFGQITLQ